MEARKRVSELDSARPRRHPTEAGAVPVQLTVLRQQASWNHESALLTLANCVGSVVTVLLTVLVFCNSVGNCVALV